jgi:hypothetical protein
MNGQGGRHGGQIRVADAGVQSTPGAGCNGANGRL